METMSFITPIPCTKIKNLSITDYLIIYKDKDNKLKRAIPDFSESFISFKDSLIDEALVAERCGIFKILSRKKFVRTNSPKFCICVGEDGTINKYKEETVKLDNLLLDSTQRKNISKILKLKK